MRFAKPIDTQLLKNLLKEHYIFITIEENTIGGFSSQVNNFFLNQNKNEIKIFNFFMKDEFIDQSDINDQYKLSGISSVDIYKKVSNYLN